MPKVSNKIKFKRKAFGEFEKIVLSEAVLLQRCSVKKVS